jgi:hypothetical protein
MTFSVVKRPQGMALDEEGVEEFAVSFRFVEFDFLMGTMHVILLKGSPECREAAPDEMVPSDSLLFANELLIGLGVLCEFVFRQVGVIEIRAHTGKKDMY